MEEKTTRLTDKKIEESLIEQLKKNGKDISAYQALIKDYMFFHKKLRAMKTDVNKKGLSYDSISSTGKPYVKDNPCIKSAQVYSSHMLKILQQLGLDSKSIDSEPEDDDL